MMSWAWVSGILACSGSDPAVPEPVASCEGPSCLEERAALDQPPQLVVMAVLDTVRAQSASLCGHDRPTTPFLESMAAAGASWTCLAEAPSSWTIPSHASFFTGVNVAEHGSHRVGKTVRPLDDSWNTLAERYRDQGFDTVCISANSFVSETVGLTQGCDFVRKGRRNLTGREVVEILQEQLAVRTPGRPLFVFLNFYEAHTPWQPIPSGLNWVRERQLPENDASHRWSYVRGEMKSQDAKKYLAHVRDLYDYGVFLEDQYLGQAFEVLRTGGWMERGTRWVVTSDHGELLGEHGLLNHGKTLYEPVTRVPLLHFSWPASGSIAFPSTPHSATTAFHLALDGSFQDLPVVAVDLPFPYWSENTGGAVGDETWLASWSGDRKLVWEDGVLRSTDLATDPGESDWQPWNEPPPEELQRSLDAVLQRVSEGTAQIRPEMLEMLQALGYAN